MSSPGFLMRSHNYKGFSAIELLIGLSIIVLLATITVVELRQARRGDELRTAARQLAGDIRAMQSRALSAKNLKTCDAGGGFAVCEASDAVCGGTPCDYSIPAAFGVHLVINTSTYAMFADINPAAGVDYHFTDSHEIMEYRSVLPLATDYVIIDQITSTSSTPVPFADISFMRQNGTTRLYDDTVPPEPAIVKIRLLHTISNKTMEIEVNRVTGRISIL